MTSPHQGPVGESTFIVELNAFNGPLDLLLSLIRDEKIDIYDIPIAHICKQFLVKMHAPRFGVNCAPTDCPHDWAEVSCGGGRHSWSWADGVQ